MSGDQNAPAGGVDALEPTSGGEAVAYQRLRSHVAKLGLTAAAEVLTGGPGSRPHPGPRPDRRPGAAARRRGGPPGCCASPLCRPRTPLADFDFTAQPGVDEKLIRELALLRFLDDAGNILLVRFPAVANDDQVIAGTGFLLCALGTACIYYGDEQGLAGAGGDNQLRQALFDAVGNRSLLNTQCRIYQEIAKIADVMRTREPLRFGRMYYRQISGNGLQFGFPFGSTYILAFSRILYPNEVLIAYNVSSSPRQDSVVVDATLHPDLSSMTYLYGGTGTVPVQSAPDGTRFVKILLAPHQSVILH